MKKIYYLMLVSIVGTGNYYSQTSKAEKKPLHFVERIKSSQKHEVKAEKTSQYVLPGRSINFNWDNTVNNWDFQDTAFYTYNVNGLVSEILRRNNGSKNRTLYTYDSKEREILVLNQYWDSFTNNWENNSRTTTTYDSNDNQTDYIFETYNTISNFWSIMYGTQNTYTYTTSNLISSQIIRDWNSSNQTWKDNQRYNYQYNSNGAVTQEEYQTLVGGLWVNNFRYSYVYDTFGKMIEVQEEDWDGVAYSKLNKYINISWQNWTGDMETSSISSYTTQSWDTPVANQWNTSGRTSITYDAFGGYVGLDETYTNSTFENDVRYSELYDNKYNYTGFKNETWNSGSSQWETDYGTNIMHTYDGSNRIIESIWQDWDNTASAYENSRKSVYSDYQTITGINLINANTFISANVYPTPCSANCNLQLDSKTDLKNASILVYDVTGKLVYTTEITNPKTSLNLEGLTAGIYFYSISSNNSILTKGKIVVE